MRWIVRLAALAAALVLGRQLWDRQLEMQAAREDLAGQRAGIESAEREIDELDRSIDDSEAELRDRASRIAEIEGEYPGGIPASVHPSYAALVAEHNAAVARHNELVAREHELHGDYKRRVDRHNDRVASANALATRGAPCAMLPAWLRMGACRGDE